MFVRMTMNPINKLISLFLLMAGSCFAQQPQVVIDRAKEGIPKLRTQMLDPGSFVVDRVYVVNPGQLKDRDGVADPVICYDFRSKNTYGGYAQGLGEYHLMTKYRFAGQWVVYVWPNEEWSHSRCLKKQTTDITADVLKDSDAAKPSNGTSK
jgi:hypothetical protein